MKGTLAWVALLASLAGPPGATGQTPSAGSPTPVPPQAPADRPVSWKQLLHNVIDDQKHIWSFPAGVAQGKDLIPSAAVLGATAGLIATDPSTAGYFRGTSAFHGFNNVFTGNATSIGMITAPVSLYAAGLIRKDPKMQHTALLAGEAVADVELLTVVLKNATSRARPAQVPPAGNYGDSWFENRKYGSFPSGHTIAAFSVATVVARRYGNHRWVPYAAYGLAAVVGFSRLSLSAHFLSDVFVGGALGYSVSRFGVLRQ
jgi:hypothetical protein